MRSKERTDIYTRVTNEIVAAIEAGAGSWTMPWHHDGSATSRPINAGTGTMLPRRWMLRATRLALPHTPARPDCVAHYTILIS